MCKVGFDNEKYLRDQSKEIRSRIDQFGGKLYLEFGGKLFDDNHASRVLPGFQPDSKLKMLHQLKDQAEIIIVINAEDIEKNKIRGDLGITYDQDVLRLIDVFRSFGLFVGSVVITRFTGQSSSEMFQNRLEALGIRVYRHYPIEGYPTELSSIVSEEGFGKNDYIETSRSLIVVTAPGPGSGKMAVCLSQLYNDYKCGIASGYAKYETFPVWNLSLKHPVNLAYEAATADLSDVNMIDPFHFEAHGEVAVNYNRDVEIFPVLNAMFERIYGESPYKSPTDMGVNMVGNCITDDEAVCDAAKREIIRRYFAARCSKRRGDSDGTDVRKIELLMKRAEITSDYREVTVSALKKEEDTGEPAAAIRLPDGRVITGKTTELLGAVSAMILNALKALGGIDDSAHLIPSSFIQPVQALKTTHLGSQNPRLHTDEILVALSISASTDPRAQIAMEQLDKLRNCDAHSTVILSRVDSSVMSKLGITMTCEPKYQTSKLYHK